MTPLRIHPTDTPASPRQSSAPAWVSAGAALFIAVIAAFSMASAPATETLKDHEDRIRLIERDWIARMQVIEGQLRTLNDEIRILRRIAVAESERPHNPPY